MFYTPRVLKVNVISTSIRLFFFPEFRNYDIYLHMIYTSIIMSCIIRKVIELVFRLMAAYSLVYLTKSEAAIHE